jgi:hypothetical protein
VTVQHVNFAPHKALHIKRRLPGKNEENLFAPLREKQ